MEESLSIRVFIESEAGSGIRNRYDETSLVIRESFPIRGSYPYPYGFILDTGGGGRDSLDCYVLTPRELTAGSTWSCEIVGLLEMIEDGETDHKILAALPGEDPALGAELRDKLAAFIEGVFTAFPEARVGVGRILGREEAEALVRASMSWQAKPYL